MRPLLSQGPAPLATSPGVTYRELAAASNRIVLGLHAPGIRKGDTVSFQLNNRWEFLALVLGCIRSGSVTNPVMPVLRHRELTFMFRLSDMFRLSEARILIVPDHFRGFNFAKMAHEVAAEVPILQHVFTIGGDGWFERHFLDYPSEDEFDGNAVFAAERPDPNDIMQLICTSGTTGEPKGVMHTANTIFANVIPFAERLQLAADDVGFMPSPLAHQLGCLFGILIPLLLGERACAFVQTRESHTFNFEQMRAFLREKQVSPTDIPEHLVVVDEMPATASGEVRKFTLREQAGRLEA